MGIPLAALAINTQQPSPLDTAVKAMSLKNLMAEGQTRQLQQTGLEQENQQRALQLQDQQTLRSLSSQHVQKDSSGNVSGFDFDGLIKDAAGAGVSPQTLNQIQNQHAEAVKNMAGAQDAVRNQELAKNKALYEGLESLRSIQDPAQRQAALPGLVQSLAKQGVDTSKIPPNTPLDDNSLNQFEAGLGMHAQVLADAKTSADTNKAKQDAIKDIQETAASKTTQARTQQVIDQGGDVEQREMADYLSKNPGKGPMDFARAKALLSPQAQLIAQFGAGGQKAPLSDTVIDALAAPGAKLKLSDVIPPRAPMQVKQAAIDQILQKYPNYATSDYDIEKGVMKSATSGKIADSLTAFNTAISHATQAQSAADALDNGDVRTLNKVGNALGLEFGSDKTTNFNAIKSALTGEVSKVFKGGQATDAEIKEVQGPLNAANSPAQLKGALNTVIHLMNSKRDALKQQVDQGEKGKPNFGADTTKPPTHPFFDQFGGTVRPNQ